MTPRKFYKTTYVVEILSEEPVPNDLDLREVLNEAESGSYSGDIRSADTVELNGKEMADALNVQRSSTDFFGLDEEGNHRDDLRCKLCGDAVPELTLREHLEEHQPNARGMDDDAVAEQFEEQD